MPSCIIKGCFNTWKQKDSKVILHVFPRDKNGIRLWLSQSPENFPNVEELVEKIYSQNAYGTVRLCSKHFNDDQYFHEGTKRRLRPNALPTIFTFESPPSKTPDFIKGLKRKRKSSSTDPSQDGEIEGGASSSVLFYTQTPDGGNAFVQQVLPSPLQFVLPSTSLLGMEKPRMADKAINTDAFFSKKCQAVGTDPLLGKKNANVQTKPWKGKSQGVLCTILNGDATNPGQHRSWQSEKIWSNSVRYPTTSLSDVGKVANSVLPKQEIVSHTAVSSQAVVPNNKSESDAISQKIKVEPMSPPRDCGHSLNSNQDGSSNRRQPSSENGTGFSRTIIVRPKKEDDSESGTSTDDDSETDDVSTKSILDNDAASEAKFTVLQSCLYDLIKLVRCQYRDTCHAPLTNVQVKTLGSVIAIDVLCCKGHNSTLWHSQTVKMSAGNLLPTSGGPSQQFGGSEVETFFHNLDYTDELPQQ